MQNEEKLIFVHSDLLLHKEQFDALRKKISTLTDDGIRNFMYFYYIGNEDVGISLIMACTDDPDFFPHPTEIIKDIRKRDFLLMSFKTLKQFLCM